MAFRKDPPTPHTLGSVMGQGRGWGAEDRLSLLYPRTPSPPCGCARRKKGKQHTALLVLHSPLRVRRQQGKAAKCRALFPDKAHPHFRLKLLEQEGALICLQAVQAGENGAEKGSCPRHPSLPHTTQPPEASCMPASTPGAPWSHEHPQSSLCSK